MPEQRRRAQSDKWLERTVLASRRLLEGEQAPRRIARRSATPLGRGDERI